MYHSKLGKAAIYRDRPDSAEGESREHLCLIGARYAPNPPHAMTAHYDVLVFELGRPPRWIGGATEGTGAGTFSVLNDIKGD